MPKTDATLDLIVASAPPEAAVWRRTVAEVDIDFAVPRVDGDKVTFKLVITASNGRPSVRERHTDLLPAVCPERHINRNGSFCMNWDKADPLIVADADGAARWWETLVRYLQLQLRSKRSRRWPGPAWAHGDAAIHQRKAEFWAGQLGPSYERAIAQSRLVVQRSRGAAFIQLLRDGRRVYSVWSKSRRVATLRQRCVCDAPQGPLTDCHAEAAAGLVLELCAMEHEEARFWRHLAGTPCCGSLDVCPLKVANDQPLTATKRTA